MGLFTTSGEQSRNYIGRLNADGTLDTSFNGEAGVFLDDVYSLAVQADGKILVGGDFTTLGGQTRYGLGRLNANGTLDASFIPALGETPCFDGCSVSIYSLAVQADGKILVGGGVTTLGGQSHIGIGRLNADGRPDT